MKILMTTDTVGGVWTYALELARALQQSRVRIWLATMGAPLRPEQREEVEQISSITLIESSYKLEWMQDPWDDVAEAGEWLLSIERAIQPDLVHLNGYVHAALPWRCPILVVGHSCVLSWWQAVKGGPAPAEWDHYRLAVSRGLRSADMVLAPTSAMLSALRRHYGCLTSTAVIPNGRGLPPGTDCRKEHLIFSAGRLWDEAKNLSILDRAAPHLEWPVYLAGPTSSPDGSRHHARHATLLGQLGPTELAHWMSRAAIYVLPARYEPFGLSILEAALAGCALVLGDIPSLREVWRSAALYVPPNDALGLRQTVSNLVEDPVLRLRMGARARARARRFTPARMARGYLRAYAELLPGYKRRRVQLT